MADAPRPDPAADASRPPDPQVTATRRAALSEDWAATVVGLLIVVLAAAGVITDGWLPL